MAFKPDEVHVKQFSRKLRYIVVILAIAVISLLIYLAAYSFAYVSPLVTVLLLIILILVAGIIIVAIDVSFYREIS